MSQEDKTASPTASWVLTKGNHPKVAKHQSRRRTFKGSRIRVPIFLLALVGSVIAGVIFISLATPGRESASLMLNPPLRIDAFATSPNVSVDLNLIINTSRSCPAGAASANCEKGFVGDLYGTVTRQGSIGSMNPDSKILIVSTKPAYPPANIEDLSPESAQTAVQVADLSHAAPSIPDINLYSISVGKMEQTQGDSQYGAPIAEFRLAPVTEEANGSFFGHLPDIGFLSSALTNSNTESSSICDAPVGTSPNCRTGSGSTFEVTGLLPMPPSLINGIPWILTEVGQLHGRNYNDMILMPNPKEDLNARLVGNISDSTLLKLAQNPSNYPTIPGSQHDLYWPTRLLATEVLAGAQSILMHARIDSILPANGSLQGDSYIWQGTGSLEPTISATNMSAAESQSIYAFASGIAFATAAAALIALVQEVPKKVTIPNWRLRWHRIRRKRDNQRSARQTDCGLGWPG